MQSARSLGRLAGALGVLVAAACGDRLVEWFALATSDGRYVDRGHQAVLPIVMLALAVATAAAAWQYFERCGCGTWFEGALRVERDRGIVAHAARTVGTATGAAALALAMETVERALGGGAPFGGLPLVGANALAFVAICLACAAATSSASALGVAAIVDALDAVTRTVAAVLVWIARYRPAVLQARTSRSTRRSFACVRVAATRCHGDRAPPIPTFATTR